MALTMDNAYHTKIVTNNEPGADIADMELRKLLFAGSILLLPASAGAKAGVWASLDPFPAEERARIQNALGRADAKAASQDAWRCFIGL